MSCECELEEHGFPFDGECYMDADDARELKDLVNSTSAAFKELMEANNDAA